MFKAFVLDRSIVKVLTETSKRSFLCVLSNPLMLQNS